MGHLEPPTPRKGQDSAMIFSSPIQATPRNVLDDLHLVQKERSLRRCRPFSSPIRNEDRASNSITRSPIKHEHAPNGHQGVINTRNKHNKLTRKQFNQEKVLAQRNRVLDTQASDDTVTQLNKEIDELSLDIDTLIEEERDLAYDAYIEDYENEFDEYELQQELELIELMSQMELNEVNDKDMTG